MTELENKIVEANTSYCSGKPTMTDQEWENIMAELKRVQPESELLKKGSLAINMSGDRMAKLPLPMYSLEKVKSIEELNEWAEQFPVGTKFCVSFKYDGISLLVSNSRVWTRGDGEQGQKSMDRFIYVNDKSTPDCNTYMWGEAIMPKNKFEKYLESGEYKVARNLVAGQFNADNFSPEIMRDIDFIAYGTDNYTSKEEFFTNQDIPHLLLHKMDCPLINPENGVEELHLMFRAGLKNYVIDGLVIEVDNKEVCDNLGRLPNGNPKYAVALKLPEWFEKQQTTVREIEWNVSKDGKIKPVAIIDPVELGGVTINRATCYNAAFIFDNNIAKCSKIELVRSGDVIPKILKTIDYEQGEVDSLSDSMVECPECGCVTKWDSNMVEIMCTNPDCRGKRIREMVYFLETMGIEEMGEPTVKKLYDSGISDIAKLFNAELNDFTSVEGIGAITYFEFSKQKSKLFTTPVPVARFMTALNVFGGTLAEKSAQLIIDELGWGNQTMDNMVEIKGVGTETARAYDRGFDYFLHLTTGQYSDIRRLLNITYEKPKVKQTGKSVCFSGVRDKALEEELSGMGHKIASGVSKTLNLLVVADVNGTSSKITKAKSLGIQVITIDQKDKIIEILNE